jgi:hypothetical protein
MRIFIIDHIVRIEQDLAKAKQIRKLNTMSVHKKEKKKIV